MRTAALFKAEAEEYREAFRGAGLQPVFVEPLRFELVNATPLRDQLHAEHDALVLTSPRAVDALAAGWAPGLLARWAARAMYAVGGATAAAAAVRLGLTARGADSGSAAALGELVARELPAGARVLFPAGALAADALPAALRAAGLRVLQLTAYETAESARLVADLRQLAEARPACLVFFSPSGCEYVHRRLQTFDNDLSFLPHFAIGNSTAHKVQNLGVDVAGIAEKPDPDHLVRSIIDYFTKLDNKSS